MGKREVKQELKKLEHDQLLALIMELYDKHKVVKAQLDFFAVMDEAKLMEPYRKRVTNAIGGRNGLSLNLADGKAAIAEFKKMGASPHSIAELYLYYTELGVQFTIDFGDIDARFYNSVSSAFHAACKIIHAENLQETFRDRAERIKDQTSWMGWGFGDEIGEIYLRYF
jgi:hypothetical protein